MRALRKFFNPIKKPFILRYSKVMDEWELIYNREIVCIGNKEMCLKHYEYISSATEKQMS